jgi:hypothetical protein
MSNKLSAGKKVSKVLSDHPVITALTVVTVIVGLAVLVAKLKNHSDADLGRYTEFDTNH